MFKSLIGLFVALIAFGLTNTSLAQGELPIRVLLASGSDLRLIFPASHDTMYMDGTLLNRSNVAQEWRLSASGNSVQVQTQNGNYNTKHNQLVFTTATNGGYFLFGGKPYRGNALIIASGNYLELINSLSVEDYVRGVVGKEMPSSWPQEALKAQAIIARTYAISRLNQKGNFDLCATEACQVYGGADAETSNTDTAVQNTQGLIISYNNHPAETYFHADSGGYLASAQEIWGKNLPYLRAHRDPESQSPLSSWNISPTGGTIANAIARFAPQVGNYVSLSVTEYSESSRVWGVQIEGTAGRAYLAGRTAQAFMRSLGARSTVLRVSSTSPLILAGAGAGHGVGLSQWGALGYAKLGWAYDQILGYYYQGVALANYTVLP